MKTSDFIAKRIRQEAEHAFGVTGGCIINVVDSFYRNCVKTISVHHEQSAAIAADAYARFRGFGVCYATSGPGITNLITGVACSYYDSIPVLVVGGQVPSKFLNGPDRQMGFQEVNGVALMWPVTKYSTIYRGSFDLEDCIISANTPRKGPTFIEIPDDRQRHEITCSSETKKTIKPKTERVCFKFKKPDKPLLILGRGAKGMSIEARMPLLYTWGAKDACVEHPWSKGDFGITGSPHGNKLIKEATHIIMVGTRMDSHQVPDWDKFAPEAHKIAIGIDFPHKVDAFIDVSKSHNNYVFESRDWCKAEDYEPIPYTPAYPAYRFIDDLSDNADPSNIIIPDMGQIGCIAFQRWKVKQGQALFNGMNHSPMGYALPGSIGAAVATGGKRRVIVIVGDGSLMMNLHDLQTISDMRLPINIFVVNNGGYGMIRQTQGDWKEFLLQGVGCNFKIPNVKKLASAFKLKYTDKLSMEPSIFEVKIPETKIVPKWKFGTEL